MSFVIDALRIKGAALDHSYAVLRYFDLLHCVARFEVLCGKFGNVADIHNKIVGNILYC